MLNSVISMADVIYLHNEMVCDGIDFNLKLLDPFTTYAFWRGDAHNEKGEKEY